MELTILQQISPGEASTATELGAQIEDLMKILENNVVTIKKKIEDALSRRNQAQNKFDRLATSMGEYLFRKSSGAEWLQMKETFDQIQHYVLFLFNFIHFIISFLKFFSQFVNIHFLIFRKERILKKLMKKFQSIN